MKDDDLLLSLEALARQEREDVADIIGHLAEVDRRELALDRGYSTLFDYCRRRLGYSEAAAFLRIRAARAAARYPRVLADLRAGRLHLDAVMRLYPHLDAQNCDKLLDAAAGLSKREVLALTARLGAQTPVERDVIRPLPSPAAAPPPPALDCSAAPLAAESPRPGETPSVRRVDAALVVPPRVRLAFTAEGGFLAKVERLRGLLRHKFPAGRLEDLLGEAVTQLLARIEPARRACRRATEARARPSGPRWRRVPAAVKAEVWKRDGGRCAYVAEDGRRCEATEWLELDHVIPYALGGRSDCASNIRLLCRPHNQRLARKRFGPRRRD